MAKFVCKVCGYVYEGDAAPAECPVCHVGADMFEEVKGEMKLAAEHEYGIYAKTVKNNPDISDEDKKYHVQFVPQWMCLHGSRKLVPILSYRDVPDALSYNEESPL